MAHDPNLDILGQPVRLVRSWLRSLGSVALLVWILGFEVGPAIHVGLHEQLGPHAHDGDEIEGGQAFGRFDHSDAEHEDEHGGERDRHLDPWSPEHGEHSVAHRSLATIAGVLDLWSPPPITALDHPPPGAPQLDIIASLVETVRVRGPPQVSPSIARSRTKARQGGHDAQCRCVVARLVHHVCVRTRGGCG
jgi:hypothetical protein